MTQEGCLVQFSVAAVALFLTLGAARAQAATAATPALPMLEEGAIGVAYVVKSKKTTVTLRVVFPGSAVGAGGDAGGDGSSAPASKVMVPTALWLFDAKGALAQLPLVKTVKRVFWCENDGGKQSRPEVELKVPAETLARSLRPIRELQGIAAFVIVAASPKQALETPTSPEGGKVYATGDIDGDGLVDALLWAHPDEAGNCDGKPANNLVATLRTAKGDAALRCCGP